MAGAKKVWIHHAVFPGINVASFHGRTTKRAKGIILH